MAVLPFAVVGMRTGSGRTQWSSLRLRLVVRAPALPEPHRRLVGDETRLAADALAGGAHGAGTHDAAGGGHHRLALLLIVVSERRGELGAERLELGPREVEEVDAAVSG